MIIMTGLAMAAAALDGPGVLGVRGVEGLVRGGTYAARLSRDMRGTWTGAVAAPSPSSRSPRTERASWWSSALAQQQREEACRCLGREMEKEWTLVSVRACL